MACLFQYPRANFAAQARASLPNLGLSIKTKSNRRNNLEERKLELKSHKCWQCSRPLAMQTRWLRSRMKRLSALADLCPPQATHANLFACAQVRIDSSRHHLLGRKKVCAMMGFHWLCKQLCNEIFQGIFWKSPGAFFGNLLLTLPVFLQNKFSNPNIAFLWANAYFQFFLGKRTCLISARCSFAAAPWQR